MKAAALTLALLAAPALAQTPERVAALLAAIEAEGCVVNEENNMRILETLGMTENEGSRIVSLLMSDGRAVPQGDDLRITTGTCS